MITRRGALLGYLGVPLLARAAATPKADAPVRLRPTLTVEAARRVLAACHRHAIQNGWPVAIAVVDEGGALLVFERLEGALPLAANVAIGKAQSSAAMRLPSGEIEKLTREMPGLLNVPAGIPLQGGLPLLWHGECVGAVGVSGMSAPQDEQVARVGAATLD
ncbi:MAG: heme-binding protein [Proteobacteria bacterium]|nr:heme-binding protein [Pseudomonadota bacterium]